MRQLWNGYIWANTSLFWLMRFTILRSPTRCRHSQASAIPFTKKYINLTCFIFILSLVQNFLKLGLHLKINSFWLNAPYEKRHYYRVAPRDGLIHLWPGYFLTWPDDIFLTRSWKNCDFRGFSRFRGGWCDLTQPEHQKMTQSRSRIFGQDPSLSSDKCSNPGSKDGPWPNPTQAYFWSAINKRLTRIWPWYLLTQLEDFFFEPEG